MGHGTSVDSLAIGLELIPEWARRLGVAVWVTGLDRRVRFLNERAEILLEVSASKCLGKRCYAVVSGTDPSGQPFCKPDCPLIYLVRTRRPEIEPIEMRITGPTTRVRWVTVLVIPVMGPRRRNTAVVHCALEDGRSRRIEAYLSRVISHRSHASGIGQVPPNPSLTRRESEILELLAENENLGSIAERLYVCHATVRNHVQHILSKLGVHSIREAVAYYLLRRD